MTGSVKQDVSIRVALSGQESWKSYREAMANARSETAKLKQDLKEIANLGKAFETQKIFNTKGGFYQTVNGQAFQGRMRAQRQMDMGLTGMQELAQAKETLRLSGQLLKTFDSIGGILASNQVKIGTKAATLQKINSISEAQNRLVGTEIQLTDALKQKDVARIADLSRQRDILKEQVALLQQQQKQANKPTQAQLTQRSRSNTLDRLFGDGGASLMAVQAGISANYMLLNGARSAMTGSLSFAAEFDEALRNMQAISVVTDENLQGLKETITSVSQETKFMATEVANAALILGQAGFSVDEIQNSIQAVTLLAAATGTDLKQSVDIATSVIGVFNMESSQMGSVANTLTSAVNMSKLNIDKLALGLQYAGNTAAQSGVSFEELTAALGAMSNAGIRSGSTLGTGMRQILISLEKPSENFKGALDRLGISLNDIDLRANGLYGVMKNLKEGGFSASDAIQSFEVRAAAAFNALSGNIEDIVALERAFLNQTSAMQANETQMRAVSNQWKRFQSNLQVVVATGLEPLTYALRDVLLGLSSFLEGLREYPTALRVVTTGIGAFVAAFALVRTATLAWNLTSIITGLSAVGGAATVAGIGVRSLLGPFSLILTALTLGFSAWSSYSDEVGRAAAAVEKARTAFDDATGAVEQTRSEVSMVEGKIKELSDRPRTLAENQNLLELETEKVRSQFKEMGIEVSQNINTVEGLIESLSRLRGALSQKYVLQIEASKDALENLITANDAKISSIVSSMGDNRSSLTKMLGVGDTVSNWATNPYLGVQKQGNLMLRARNADTNTLEENQSLFAEMTAMVALQKSQRETDPGWQFNSPQDQALNVLEVYVGNMKQVIDLQATRISQQRQLNDLATEEKNATNRLANPGIDASVTKFAATARARVMSASAGIKNDPVQEFDAANGEMTRVEVEAEKIKAEIRASVNLNASVQEALIQEIDNALAESNKVRDQLLEKAQEVAQDNAKLKTQLAEVSASRYESSLGKANTGAEVDYLSAKRAGAANDIYNAGVEDLRLQTGGDTESEAYLVGLEKLKVEREQTMEKIRTDAVTRVGEILNRDAAATENTIKSIELKIRETGESDFVAREELYAQLAQAISEQADQKVAIAESTIENIEDRGNEIDAIRNQEREALLGLLEKKQADDVAEAQAALDETDRALTEVALLAEKTTSLAALNSLLKQAMTLLARRAREARALADANSGDGITPEGAATDNSEVESKLLDKFNTWRSNIGKYGHAGGSKYGSGGKGGGGGSKKSEVDLMLEQMQTRVKSVEALIKANLLDSATGVGTITDIIEDAKTKLAEVDAKIAAMQSKVNGGQMAEKDLERLNDLLKAREGLTKAATEAEAMLTQEMIKQGDYWGAAKNITVAWAKENLDLTKEYTSGVQGVLSSLTSGFATLFTDLANRPKQAGQAFRSFAISIIESMQQMIAKMLAVYAMQKLIGWIFPGAQAEGSLGAVMKGPVGLPTAMTGKYIRKAAGGEVTGNLARDSKPHLLMPGEFVLRKSAVDMIGVEQLSHMNAMGNRAMATGGHIGVMNQKKGPMGQTNVYVVSPEQKPVPGPNDIVAIISDDIARGGPTKKLIKSVAMGF